MTQELSSLMDGELEGQEAQRAIRGCCGNEELRQKWQVYHLIGDAMRGDEPARGPSTDRILAALRDEPTVLAPKRVLGGSAGRVAFAAAASVATVAAVVWIGVQDRTVLPGPSVARNTAAPTEPAAVQAVAATVVPLHANEYVVVHRQLPSADFYRPASATAVVAR